MDIKERADALAQHLHKEYPLVEFTVRCRRCWNYDQITVKYQGNNDPELFNSIVKAVEEYGGPSTKLPFIAHNSDNCSIALFVGNGVEYKIIRDEPSERITVKGTGKFVKDNIAIGRDGHIQVVWRERMECGHLDHSCYTVRSRCVPRKRRIVCWECSNEQTEKAKQEHEAFLRSIGIEGRA